MNRNQIAVITSPGASPPATPVQRQTRSGALYAGAIAAELPQTNVHRCKSCGQPRKGHPRSGCSNVDPPIPRRSPSKTPRQTTSRAAVSNPGYNIVNQQQVNLQIHIHALPTVPPALDVARTPPPADPHDPPSPSMGDPSDPPGTTLSSPLTEVPWDHIHALLRARPISVVTIAMAQEDLASKGLAAQEHGYAVKLIYPEDSWEDPDQGLFIVARNAAALRGTYNRARKAANSGSSLATIVREESYQGLGDTVKDVVDAMAGLDVGGSESQGSRKSRKPRKSRKTST